MIIVTIKQARDQIEKLVIKGHAESNVKGKDLVCAGVSSIVVGLLNALDQYGMPVEMNMNEGFVQILVEDLNNKDLQLILNTGVIQLKTMEKSYSEYIRIEKEV